MASSERVTIGITCFNARETIARAIASARAQDWPELEILIVDDCSTDGSPDLVEQLIADDKRARLVRREQNGGAAATRNTIIDEATGEFVAFFDDDDESLPSRVATQIKAIRRCEADTGSKLVACYAGGERHYPNGYVKPLEAIGSRGEPLCGAEVSDYLLFYRRRPDRFYGSGTPTCALMTRLSTLKALDGFDTALRRVEDIDFAIRLALAGGCFTGTAESLFIQHATTGSDKAPEANRDAEIAVAEKHKTYLKSVGRYNYARRWPNLRYYHFTRQYGRFVLEFLAIASGNPFVAIGHLLATGPRRLAHERRMSKRRAS